MTEKPDSISLALARTAILGQAPRLSAGLVVWMLCTVPAALFASGEDPFASDRAVFLRAESALAAGQIQTYRRLAREIGGYPLIGYLEFAELKRRLSKANGKEIQGFLSRHGDAPVAGRLRRLWLGLLAKQSKWTAFLEFYVGDHHFGTTLECHRAHALHVSGGQITDLLAEELWLVAKSQPDACDPVFRSLAKSGWLAPGRVWHRIELAMDRGKTRLAAYLGRFLPAVDRPWLSRWLEVRRKPETVTELGPFQQEHRMREIILVYGVSRLARYAPKKAESAWRDIVHRFPFTSSQKLAVEKSIALRYAALEHKDAEPKLAAVDVDGSDARVREVRIVNALKRRDWKLVVRLTEVFARSESSRWRYWHARGLYEAGREQAGERLMTELAGQRSYYGFLAADKTGLPYNLNSDPVSVDSATLGFVRRSAGVQRAAELFRLGRMVSARREWRWTTRGFTKKQLAAAAIIADEWRWHHQAIFTIAKARCYDDLEMRFPLVFPEEIHAQAKKNSLEPAWVLAVMRQESAFNSGARSSAGALGLMQIMPGTGKYIAKSLNLPYRRRQALLDTNTNIRFGTHYLGSLLRKLNQHRTLATAAYNAGPHRVKKWLPNGQDVSGELWVETVPFRETRKYLTRVLAYTAIYENRIGKRPTPISQILSTVPSRTRRTTETTVQVTSATPRS